jgi:hypothetical protein
MAIAMHISLALIVNMYLFLFWEPNKQVFLILQQIALRLQISACHGWL